MRNLRLGSTLIALSVLTLVAGRLQPTSWFEDIPYANATFCNVVAGLFFYFAIYVLGLQSLEYFRLPRVGLDDVSTYPLLMDTLTNRGWSAPELEKLGSGNILRVLGNAEEVAQKK
jgi:hypothetical protein